MVPGVRSPNILLAVDSSIAEVDAIITAGYPAIAIRRPASSIPFVSLLSLITVFPFDWHPGISHDALAISSEFLDFIETPDGYYVRRSTGAARYQPRERGLGYRVAGPGSERR